MFRYGRSAFFIVLTTLSLMLLYRNADARYHPGIHWRTASNGLITVYYPSGHEPFARRVLSLSNEVHGDVNGYLFTDTAPLAGVLHPQTDNFNGFYAPFPNRISLYETPYYDLTYFGETLDDLVDQVYTHEYTHYAHITMRRGWFGSLARLLGRDGSLANALSPGWMVEGLPTVLETRFTKGGRGRSTEFLHKTLLFGWAGNHWGLSAAGSNPLYGPPSSRIYNAGYFMVDYISHAYGDSALAAVAAYQSAHPIRGTAGALKAVTGKNPPEFYREFLKEFTTRADSIAAVSTQSSLSQGDTLYADDLSGVVSHFWTSGNTIKALVSGYDRRKALIEFAPGTGEEISSIPVGRIYAVPPIRNIMENSLLFAEPVPHPLGGGDIDVNDLFQFDPVTKKRSRLTRNAHIFSADISPDGDTIVAVQRDGMWMDLVLMDSDGSNVRTLIGDDGLYWQSPCWSPDGSCIAITLKSGENTDIALVDPHDGSYKTLFRSDAAGDSDPSFSPDGRWIVFATARSGAWNIHAFDREDERLYQLTSVFPGAREPFISPDGKWLSYLLVSETAHELRVMPFDPFAGEQIAVQTGTHVPMPDLGRLQPEGDIDEKGIPLRAYAPYLHIPYPGTDEEGLTASLLLLGGDPVQINTYAATIGYGPGSDRMAYDLNFTNRSFWPELSLRLYDKARYNDMFGGLDNIWYRERGGEAFAGLDIIHRIVPTSIRSYIETGVRYRQFEGLDGIWINPRYDESVAVYGSYTMTDFPDSAPRDMVPGWGRLLHVMREERLGTPETGLAGHTQVVIARQFVPAPVRHHGLALTAYLQHQGGVLRYNPAGLLPRGYGSNDIGGLFYKDRTLNFSAEYRFPILFIDRGIGVNFMHFNLFRGSLFADHGGGWDDVFSYDRWHDVARTSYGATFSTQFHLFSYVPLEFGFGFGYKPVEEEPFAGVILSLPDADSVISGNEPGNPVTGMMRRIFLPEYNGFGGLTAPGILW